MSDVDKITCKMLDIKEEDFKTLSIEAIIEKLIKKIIYDKSTKPIGNIDNAIFDINRLTSSLGNSIRSQ